jgi:NADPH:quinone reductase-like Zn-dependent oxidoreductase
MSLRGRTIERSATLPDGRQVVVHVGVPEDPYIPRAQLETVDVELHSGGHVLAAVNTVLDPDQESEAEQLAREIASKLESGEIEPTAHAIEPFADTLR